MATTQTAYAPEALKGMYQQSQLHAFMFPVLVSGGYLTASKPNFDMAAAIATRRQISGGTINVKRVTLFVDGIDGGSGANRYTAPNAQIALSSTGSNTNNVLTFRIDSGATNGDSGGTEITDNTVLNHVFVFLVVLQESGGFTGAL